MTPIQDGPLPILVISGFLGSGKTTLLNRLLISREFADAAVLINEFGEVGIDHLLVRHAREDLVVLESGCVCCTLRRDLVEQLSELIAGRTQGSLPAFRRVVLETTGIADPSPIVQTLVTHPLLKETLYLDGIVTTVDAQHALSTLSNHPESEKQVAIADRLVLTKVDLVEPSVADRVEAAIRDLNPAADIARAVRGELSPSFLRDVGHLDARRGVRRQPQRYAGIGHDHDHEGGHRVTRLAVTLPHPIALEALSLWLAMLTQLHGKHLLRLKGVVSAHDEPAPLAIQAVQHVVYPPLSLPAIPGLEGRSHIVILTTGLTSAELREIRTSLEALAS